MVAVQMKDGELSAQIQAESAARLTILDLRDSPWVDGPGRTILEIAQALNAEGFRYIIGAFVRSGERNDYAEEARSRGLEVVPILERSAFDRAVITQVRETIERYRVDIVHTHEVRSDVVGLLCARARGARLVTTAHGWIANNWKSRVYTLLDKALLRFFDRVVVVSRRMGQHLRVWAVPLRKIDVVPNALMVDEYRPDRGDDAVRREWSVNADEALVAYIGRLSPEKGPDVFLRAAAHVLRQRRDARFVLIGIGPEEQALRQLAADLGITERVIFAGYRKDMRRVYNSIDLVVQSSYTEGMPNVVLEALLMEVPVIATDVGGTAEIVEDGQHGILLPPGSAENLGGRILQFFAERDRFRRMAQAGRERVRREFDSRVRIERMKQIYRAVVTRA